MAQRISYENLILDLYLFQQLERNRSKMFCAKLFYIFEDELLDKKIIGSYYKMYRFQYGPYNPNIGKDLMNLKDNKFLSVKDLYYEKISDFVNIYYSNIKTTKFLKEINELIDENSKVFDIFDKIINEFKDFNADSLTNYIYSLKKTGFLKQKIVDYPMRGVIIDLWDIENPSFKFILDEDWYDTIEILLDNEVSENLQKAIKDLQEGNYIILER